MEEIKKCPFCGKNARYHFNGTEGYVMCDWCGSRGAKFVLNDEICVKKEAVDFWNKRNAEDVDSV